jgi:hypothetical protein
MIAKRKKILIKITELGAVAHGYRKGIRSGSYRTSDDPFCLSSSDFPIAMQKCFGVPFYRSSASPIGDIDSDLEDRRSLPRVPAEAEGGGAAGFLQQRTDLLNGGLFVEPEHSVKISGETPARIPIPGFFGHIKAEPLRGFEQFGTACSGGAGQIGVDGDVRGTAIDHQFTS